MRGWQGLSPNPPLSGLGSCRPGEGPLCRLQGPCLSLRQEVLEQLGLASTGDTLQQTWGMQGLA